MIKCNYTAKPLAAYCIHPLFQSNEDLKKNFHLLSTMDIPTEIVALAMEYRKTANAYLSTRTIENISDIELSPLDDVNEMLVADKVQNKKDFIVHHRGSHERSAELEVYFDNWLTRLGISDKMYQQYVKIMQGVYK